MNLVCAAGARNYPVSTHSVLQSQETKGPFMQQPPTSYTLTERKPNHFRASDLDLKEKGRLFSYLHRCAEQEEGQVEEGQARQQVLLLGHGAPVLAVLTVHHHHVDHEAHDREAEDQAEQEGASPPAHVHK